MGTDRLVFVKTCRYIYYYRTTHESGTYCETQYGNHAGMGKYLQPLTVQIKTCGLDPEM